ncbi:MAG TPA: RluA family pseudouridine synthase [Gemmataceae bacterium]|nr:RluA family pseudouridine synthase [Gemmataceae bacterium]
MHVLFEDYHCLAVNKPAGLLTQAPPGVPSLEALVRTYIKEKYHKPGNVYLGIPHRLDRPVGGVIAFARNTKAAQRLAAQFQKHQVEKVYWALVQGEPVPESGIMEDWLRKLPEQSRTEVAADGEVGAKKAVLEYRCLQQVDGGTLLEICPRTGRSHQIRIQLASRGYPVWGDKLYGSSIPFGPPAELPRDQIIALHARGLTFMHPTKREPVTAMAPLPEYWPVNPT